jgi:hypothetical protein
MALQIITTPAKLRLVSYKEEFLTTHPNDEVDEEGNATYTDSQWLDEVVKRWLIRQLRVGDKILKKAAIVDKTFDLTTE